MHDVDKSDFCTRQGAKNFLVVNWTKKHSSPKSVDAKNVLELPVLKDIIELLSLQLKLTYDHS